MASDTQAGGLSNGVVIVEQATEWASPAYGNQRAKDLAGWVGDSELLDHSRHIYGPRVAGRLVVTRLGNVDGCNFEVVVAGWDTLNSPSSALEARARAAFVLPCWMVFSTAV